MTRMLTDEEIQVESIHIDEVTGLYFRTYLLKEVGMQVPQHAHDYAHNTIVCTGRARGFCCGEPIGERKSGQVFVIKAGEPHLFEALEPMTRLMCVHSTASAESIQRKGV